MACSRLVNGLRWPAGVQGRCREKVKTFPKIFQKMPFKSLRNHKKPHKQRDCEQCGRTMVEQSRPSHLYIYASCVCVRARKGMWYGRHAGGSADSSGAQPGIAARRHMGTGRQACPRPPGALTTAARYSNITHTCGDYTFKPNQIWTRKSTYPMTSSRRS